MAILPAGWWQSWVSGEGCRWVREGVAAVEAVQEAARRLRLAEAVLSAWVSADEELASSRRRVPRPRG